MALFRRRGDAVVRADGVTRAKSHLPQAGGYENEDEDGDDGGSGGDART